jgi:quercetin dioxygenase-like cupin family protein
MQQANVTETKDFKDEAVNKVTYIKTDQVAQDTYYFKAGQVLAYHRHPGGDQVFFVHEGEGTYYIDEGTEESTTLVPGVVVLAPKGVWHKIVASTDLVVSQATSQPAGLEQR